MTLIAILDDRATNRQIFSKLASSLEAGIQVQAFGDPLSALDWLDDNPPDLVVADYKMPHINGAEFTRRLRQRPYGVDVPLIMVTAYDDREDKLRALEAGATDFLQTPVDHQEFVSRARNLLLLRRHQQQAKDRALWLERALATSEEIRRDLGRDLLRTNHDALAQVLDMVPALIRATDRSGHHVFINARYAAHAGCSPEDLIGGAAYEAADAALAGRHRGLDRLVLERGVALPSFEEEVFDSAGVAHVWLTTKAPLLDDTGRTVSVLTTSFDVSDRKASERHLLQMMRHDRLTGLPNRDQLQDQITARIAAANDGFAVHAIGIDGFKPVNDAHGRAIGDGLLQAVAGRLRQLARPDDLVARWRGDEFAVVQMRGPDELAATALADRIRLALAQPFDVGGLTVRITASVGIALYPSGGPTAGDLLQAAHRSLREAKVGGRNLVRLFHAGLPAARQ